MKESYIALYDSGVGGLTLLAECVRRYPQADYLYYGDNDHAPYGQKSAEEILALSRQAFKELSHYPVRAACIACNTVTASCIDVLRTEFDFPIVGVEPALKPAVRAARGGRILLLATRATLESRRLSRLCSACMGAEVVPFCPGDLAGEIERNVSELSRVRLMLPAGKFDAAVLGCTHYIWVKERIANILGCPVFDGNAGTADHLAKIANMRSENCEKGAKNAPIFIGTAKNKNKSAFESLFLM